MFKNLPREVRDTVFLLSVIGWLIAPQAQNIPVWSSGAAMFFLFWRGYLAVRGHALPNKVVLGALMFGAFGFTWLQFGTIISRDAGVTMTVLMISIKCLELRAKRDAFVIFFLGFFTVITNFLLSQSLLTTVVMTIGVWGLLATLVNIHIPTGRPSLVVSLKKSLWMLLVGSPIMLALFFIFPRVGPLWSAGLGPPKAKTGLTESMKAGTIANLALDSSVALRLKFEGDPPPPEQIYLRGPVLSQFDGVTWTRSPQSRLFYQTPSTLKVKGPLTKYEAIIEPSGQPWVFGLDAVVRPPTILGNDVGINRDYQMLATRAFTQPVRYELESALNYAMDEEGDTVQGATQLPAGRNPKTRELGQRILSENPRASASALSRVVFRRLSTGGYSYSLNPGTFGDEPADEFWFTRKEGFCEHIASSYVILMRSMGVPARVVTGYQGGDKNPIDGYIVVRQSNAHAWAEIWEDGKGWIRQDPTFAVSPSRISAQTILQPSTGLIARTFGIERMPAFVLAARSAMEAITNGYNVWVLNYSTDKQSDLFSAFKMEAIDIDEFADWLLAFLVCLALFPTAVYAYNVRRRDPWSYLFESSLRRVRQAGHALPDTVHCTPRQVASAFAPGSPAREWFLKMDAYRYGLPGLTIQELAKLRPNFKRTE